MRKRHRAIEQPNPGILLDFSSRLFDTIDIFQPKYRPSNPYHSYQSSYSHMKMRLNPTDPSPYSRMSLLPPPSPLLSPRFPLPSPSPLVPSPLPSPLLSTPPTSPTASINRPHSKTMVQVIGCFHRAPERGSPISRAFELY